MQQLPKHLLTDDGKTPYCSECGAHVPVDSKRVLGKGIPWMRHTTWHRRIARIEMNFGPIGGRL